MNEVQQRSNANLVETTDRSELRTRQNAILPERIRKAYEEGGLYRQVYDAAGVTPDDCGGLVDLTKFPFVNKEMVRAFRDEAGDCFGGLSRGMGPGASVSHGSGTTGTATLQVSTPADRETIAKQWAAQYRRAGARAGSRILTIPTFGVRPEIPMAMAAFEIGAVLVLPDAASSSLDQLELLRPQISWAYPGWLDGVIAAARSAGKDPEAVLEPIEILWWGGRYLSPKKRQQIEARAGATIYEFGGLGDIGLHAGSCSAQNGMHIREDLFVVESLDPDTGQPSPPDVPGELVFTSLFDEGMNFVRWRSDDLGTMNTDPCACGRTTVRIRQLGRVWERTVIDEVTVMPGQIDDILYEVAGEDVPFQLVRSAHATRRPYLRLAPPEGIGVKELGNTVCAGLGVDLDVLETPAEGLVDPSGFKYPQVKDE